MADHTKSGAHGQTHERHDLSRRYGKIGISAVAAAVRYGESSKEVTQPDDAREEGDHPRRHRAA